MPTKIKCPKCFHEFPLEAALTDELKEVIEKEKDTLRKQMQDYKKNKDDEIAQLKKVAETEASKVNEQWQQKLDNEKRLLQQQLEEQLRKSISNDFENRIGSLQKANEENEEKLKLARQKEAAFLRMEQEFKTREAELEITVQKKLNEERERLAEELRRIENEKAALKESEYQLKLKELETQLEQQKKLAAEMQRKAEQGSMQLQGESQELALEEMLTTAFPFDLITEVGKGVRGADSIQIVRNNLGMECGKIIWESKRAENFGGDWIEKLKADMRSQGADVAVLVTRRYPKDMERFGEKEGVWICNFSEARALASVLRDGIIKVFNSSKSQENKGDKMNLLYSYLTSPEFAEQWKAIREGFLSMKVSIQRERDAMERLWKAREKQLEKVLLNATHIRGSIDGISGLESVDLNLLGYDEEE
ncbi:DUF2130 domain-containing protein [Niabella beijingensis]|uniref:DUF2130 domain-containing protein n=1 Tax=Niabella beijingensis TaxID=2872700 RepID=UPI001CBEDF65|nr:DUF2130 domain-containing protein [Niabella beijingensis]MBZ4187396.1 DUF2130 domain-containing protein [Niabella beijingensis]